MCNYRSHLILLLTLCTPLAGCSDNAPTGSEDGPYSYTNANQEGIGKFYMGREIAYVMGHEGARWLDRPTREKEERTDLLLQNLPIKTGDKVADIGAGTGYFSLPMARMVGDEGTVYAVDIQPEMLAIIEDRASTQGITNIERVLATEKSPALAANSINLALFVDMYHEFEWPQEVMSAVYASMVSGGKVVLVEYRAEDPEVQIKKLHKMTEQQVRKEMEAAGWVFISNEKFLPQQHFLLFEKP
jgi:FkbM family methyltransferase